MKKSSLSLLILIVTLKSFAQNTFPSQSYGGNVLSQYSSNLGAAFGFYTSKLNNHFTQNAYYDAGWKSFGPASILGAASIVQTNTIGGYAFMIYIDKTISSSNESLSGTLLMSLTNDGMMGLGANPIHNLHIGGEDTKIFVEGTTASALSLQHKGFSNNPIFEWQSYNGRIRLNYIDDTATREDIFTVSNVGNVGIGTTDPGTAKLAVEGKIASTEVVVEVSPGQGPDYVFEEDYELRSLEETKVYINENKHLPEISSAKEMEKNGIGLADMNMKLLKKIEELTLHLIDQNEKIDQLQKDIDSMKYK